MNEYNLSLDDDYVVLKMITGEQLIAVKRAETKDYLTIEYPMLIKGYAFQNGEEMGEHVTAAPYCKFTDDKIFTFDKQHIVFTKPMHSYAIPFYIGLVEEHEEYVEVPEEEPPQSVEELGDRVNKLAGFLRKMQQPEVEESLSDTVFVEGNDTKH
jgi:hypothetical protein